jgi:DNA transformation protein
MEKSDTPLRDLMNIGPTIAARLEAVGIRTLGDLTRVGPAMAFQMVRDANPDVTMPVCYYLYSLQGAIEGKHWDEIDPDGKERLLKQAGVQGRVRKLRA